MEITQVAKIACDTGACPTIFATDRDTVLIQGYVLPAGTVRMDVPTGEFIVEIPRGLLIEGAAAVRDR